MKPCYKKCVFVITVLQVLFPFSLSENVKSLDRSKREAKPIEPATIIAGIKTAVKVVGAIKSFIGKSDSVNHAKGRYIRFFHFGTLDGNTLCIEKCPNFVWVNPMFSERPNVKWTFDGPKLVTHDSKGNKLCLDYYEDKWIEKEVVQTKKCTEYKKHGWFLKVHNPKYKIINGVQRFRFSIHSENQPGKCLTATTLTYCAKHGTLHFTNESSICELRHPQVLFTLEECMGCDEQSFFVDLDFFEVIQQLEIAVDQDLEETNKSCDISDYYYPFKGLDGYNEYIIEGKHKNSEADDMFRNPVSSVGRPCLSPCGTRGDVGCKGCYWCMTKGNFGNWGFCSPRNVDGVLGRYSTYGNICTTPCYRYCKTENNGWQECGNWLRDGKVFANKIQHVTYKGNDCITDCSKWRNSYYWCKTRGYWHDYYSWDYCSPKPLNSTIEYTIYGKKCHSRCFGYVSKQSEFAPGPQKKYYYCYTNTAKNNWDYCGLNFLTKF